MILEHTQAAVVINLSRVCTITLPKGFQGSLQGAGGGKLTAPALATAINVLPTEPATAFSKYQS
jgi:hypothetical protein